MIADEEDDGSGSANSSDANSVGSHVLQMRRRFEALSQQQSQPWRRRSSRKSSSSSVSSSETTTATPPPQPASDDEENADDAQPDDDDDDDDDGQHSESEPQRLDTDSDEETPTVEAVNPFIALDQIASTTTDDFTDSSEFDSSESDPEVDGDLEIAEEANERLTVHTIVNQVPQIIGELLANEQLYIETLARGIANYCAVFDDATYRLPATLRGQKYHIFGNIEGIQQFHANTFYPSLLQCEADVVMICETFCRFVQDHRFYMYVLYAINRKRADKLTDINRMFFADRQNLMLDRLGINSFLVQPIQRLPRYQLLLRELIKELGKSLEVDGVKESIASCCRAEKHLQRLLDQVNGSMSIIDIVDNVEVDVLHQGKFRCLHEFDLYECDSRRRYRGKVFLFDKGVLVTEVIDKQTLCYRGFYMSCRLGVFELDAYNFELFDQRRTVRQVELCSDANSVALWIGLLREVVLREYEKRHATSDTSGIQQQRDSGISDSSFEIQQQFVVVRNTNNNRNQSATSSGSSAWTSGISTGNSDTSSVNSFDCDPRRTTWYTNVETSNRISNGKTLERLVNSEKHFIFIMSDYLKRFLIRIPPNRLPEHLEKYINTVRALVNYHTHHHYPGIHSNPNNIVDICATFRESLANPQYLVIYQQYAALCTKAYAALDRIYPNAESGIEHFTNTPLEHLRRANEFLEHLRVELNQADDAFVSDEFKAVAVAEMMLSKFRVRVLDNLNLNSIKGVHRNFSEEFGLVEYGEGVGIYGGRNRLLLLERGLVCVRTRISTKTQREKFIDVDFALPLSAVRTAESNVNPSRIKLFANYARNIVFKVDFATTAQKVAMQRRINVFGNMEA